MKNQLIVLLLFISFNAYSTADTLVVRDLSLAWRAMDKEGNAVTFQYEGQEVILFELPQLEENEFLLVSASEPLDFWADGQLIRHGFSGRTVFSPDSLREVFGQSRTLTLYRRGGMPRNLETKVISIQPAIATPMRIHPKDNDVRADFFLLTMLVLILLSGIYKRTFPIAFSHSFKSPLTFKMRSLSAEEAYMSFGSIDNLFMIFFFSTLLASLLVYLEIYFYFDTPQSLGGYFLAWISMLGVVYVLVLIKYLCVWLLSKVFDFASIPNVQLQDHINFLIPVLSMCLAISIIDFTVYDFHSYQLPQVVVYMMIYSLIFFGGWFYLKFDKFYSRKKLMIIAYLCTTEFLPGVLTIYWLNEL